ncbi:MAG: fibronectin-binding autotransporter adhesin [Actinomycetota bacterium]
MLAASFPRTRVLRASIFLAVTALALVVLGAGAGSAAADSTSTTTTLSVSPTAALPGASVTLTATVTGTTVPVGKVSFSYTGGGDPIGSADVTPVPGSTTTGQATLVTNALAVGSYSIKARFKPTDVFGFDSSDSTPVALVVSSVPVHATTVALTASPTTVVTGQPETFTAVVSRTDGTSPAPTGQVTFNDNGVLLQTATLVNGVATITANGFIAGSHSVVALYGGDPSDTPSSSAAITFQLAPPVVAVQTTTTVTASPNRIVAGQTITLVAHVVQKGKTTTPPAGDNVIFYADGVLIGVAPLDANGNATLTKSGWLTHTYDLTASYVGNIVAGFDTSTGATQLSLVVQDGLAPLKITGTVATIVYGSAVPAAVPTYAGFINGDSAATLTSRATCTTAATAASNVGTYPVTCTGASSPFYAISYANGAITVGPAPLTVTANSATVVTGQPIPALTTTITGFKNGQTLATSGITGAPVCTTTATVSSPAGTYPITCTLGSLAASNYTFTTPVAGTLTISPASPSVTCTGSGSHHDDDDDDDHDDRKRSKAPSSCESLLANPSVGQNATVAAGQKLTIVYMDDTPIGTGSLAPTALLSNGQLLPITVTATSRQPQRYVDDNGGSTSTRYQSLLTFTLPSTLAPGRYSILVTVHDSDGDLDQFIWQVKVGKQTRDDDDDGRDGQALFAALLARFGR